MKSFYQLLQGLFHEWFKSNVKKWKISWKQSFFFLILILVNTFQAKFYLSIGPENSLIFSWGIGRVTWNGVNSQLTKVHVLKTYEGLAKKDQQKAVETKKKLGWSSQGNLLMRMPNIHDIGSNQKYISVEIINIWRVMWKK